MALEWKNMLNCLKYTIPGKEGDRFNPELEITIGYFKMDGGIGYIVKKGNETFDDMERFDTTTKGISELLDKLRNEEEISGYNVFNETLTDEAIIEIIPEGKFKKQQDGETSTSTEKTPKKTPKKPQF